MKRNGAVATEMSMPSFVQYVGTGITASFAIHLASTIEAATHPIVTCHEIFADSTLMESIDVNDGETIVPDTPGIGRSVDESVIEKYAIERPAERPSPDRLIETRWPDGRRMYFAGESNVMVNFAQSSNNIPYFKKGVQTQLIPDEEIDAHRDLLSGAKEGPVIMDPE
jgi:hypothetical protein